MKTIKKIFTLQILLFGLSCHNSKMINTISISLYSTNNTWENIAFNISLVDNEIIYKKSSSNNECRLSKLSIIDADSIVKIFANYTKDTLYNQLQKQELEGEALYEIFVKYKYKTQELHIIGSKLIYDYNILHLIEILRRYTEFKENKIINCYDSLFRSIIYKEELNSPPQKDSVKFIPPKL